MKKYGIWIVLGLVLLIFVNGCDTYNGFVDKNETVENEWADVETQYQRRIDLVPNLIATVQEVADFEKSTIVAVTEARANATSINIKADELTPENIQKFQNAQDQLSGSLSRLLVSMERYPELKATQNFSELQAELAGTENRIAVARKRFNEAVAKYNKAIKRFPGKLYAGMFNFEEKGYFKSDEGADKAPNVREEFKK